MKHLKTFESKISSSATPNFIDDSMKDGWTVEELKSWLEEHNEDINFENGIIIRFAIKYNNYDIAKFYVDNGGDLNIRRNLVLKWAAEWGNMKALQFLYDSGMRVDERAYEDVYKWLEVSDKIPDDEKGPAFEFIKKFKK